MSNQNASGRFKTNLSSRTLKPGRGGHNQTIPPFLDDNYFQGVDEDRLRPFLCHDEDGSGLLNLIEEMEARRDARQDGVDAMAAGYAYYSIYRGTGAVMHLEHAIARMKQTVPSGDKPREPEGHEALQKDLIAMLVDKYRRTASQSDLQEVIQRAWEMVAATPLDHPDRIPRIKGLIDLALIKSRHTPSVGDIKKAGSFSQLPHVPRFALEPESMESLEAISKEELCGFANWLAQEPASDERDELYVYTSFYIYTTTGSSHGLGRAFRLAQGWAAAPPNDTEQARRSELLDLIAATRYLAESQAYSSHDVCDYPRQMAELVLSTLRNYYSAQASTECPDEDIILASGHALVALTRLLLAAHAESPPARRGAILERIINYGESALATFAATSIQASLRANLLHDLGNAYGFRSQLGKNGTVREDLDRAVELCGQAVKAVDPGHPSRQKWLSWFVQWSQGRAHLNGEDEDHFNRNIQTSLEVEAAAAQPGFARAASLAMVGDTHYARYLKSQKGDDLDRAIQLFEQAASHSDRDTMQPNALRNFTFCLLERFDQAKDIRDLDRAFEACQNLHPPGALLPNSPEQYEALIVMAVLWERRYKYTGAAADLEKFCEAADNATAIAPLTDARHLPAPILHNLGGILVIQFELTNQAVYLDRAIELDREALAISPDADPSRAVYLASLGDRLVRRSRETGSDETAEALALYENANRCVNARTSTRIAAAAAAAGIHSHQSRWEPASQHLEKAVDLLRTINPRSLKHKDKQSAALRDFPGLSSDAAAAALNAGRGAEHALRLLELGRGLIAGMMLEMRGDVSDLASRYPGLAQDFLSLREQLDISDEENRTKGIHHMAGRGSLVEGGSDSPFRWEALAQQRLDASRKLNRLLDEIRTRPGFEGFLLPPSVQQMTAAASDGPIVVVNISRFRCDAFLITRPKGITVMKLPNLTRRRVDQEAERLQKSVGFHMAPPLEWLWDDICCPVLDALGLDGTTSQGETLGRIWWVPTGLLSQLPLHAAGRYKQGGKDTVMDRIMSTYASSVKALIYGRGNGAHHATEAEFCREGDAVLVAMAETPGKGGLAFAKQELDTVKGLCSSLRLNPITPELKKEDVLRRLNGCRVFHFAGHGRSHPNDPSQSCLLLHDWRTNPLTVSDLRDNKLQENPPFLAYLSACSTGQVQVKSLVDEGIHLVGSFQLAGFRHVIGTLWEVSDAHCVAVARMFYETIAAEGMSDIAVCRGLHRATKALRDGQLHVEVEERKATLSSVGTKKPVMGNQYWTPYIHYGV